jgi:hypothetical protein
LRAYFDDLQSQRLDEALAALAPEAVSTFRDFLSIQQFNRYEIQSIAIQSPSLLDSLLQRLPWEARLATVVVDVTEPSGIRWRGSTLVPLRFDDGRWLLLEPPFAPQVANRRAVGSRSKRSPA